MLTVRKLASGLVCLAVFAAANVFAGSASLYVQDGLIACWDGIENAGAGVHDPAATVWKDLVHGYEFTLTGVTVDDDRMTFAGSATSFGNLSAADTTSTFVVAKNGTMEIVYASPTIVSGQNYQILLQSTASAGLAFGLYTSSSIIAYTTSTTTGKPVLSFTSGTATNSVSVRYSSCVPASAIANGETQSLLSSNNYWGSPDASGTTFIGVRANKANNTHFPGSIYCIRLYNRQLTDEEIVANHAIDNMRFRDGSYPDDELVVFGDPGNYGSPYPAYGDQTGLEPGDTIVASCESYTNSEQMIEYLCTGWKLYDKNGNVVSNGTDKTFTYTHPTPAAFRMLQWQWSVRKMSSITDATLPVGGAAFHVDASMPSTMTTVESSDGRKLVTAWRDADDGTMKATAGTGSRPWIVTNDGLPYVDFGEQRSGTPPSSSDLSGYLAWSSRLTTIREVFLVFSDYPGSAHSFFLGDGSGSTYDFHRNQLKLFNSQYASANVKNGLKEVDGVERTIDYELPSGFHIIHLRTTGDVTASSFARDRSNVNFGGQRLQEVIVYTSTLTDAQAGEVYDYLDKKWFKNSVLLEIDGTHGQPGSPSPAYGRSPCVAGTTVSVSCGAVTVTNDVKTTKYTCTGWKLYDVDGNVVSNGTETAFTYEHPSPSAYRRLEWQWKVRSTIPFEPLPQGYRQCDCIVVTNGNQYINVKYKPTVTTDIQAHYYVPNLTTFNSLYCAMLSSGTYDSFGLILPANAGSANQIRAYRLSAGGSSVLTTLDTPLANDIRFSTEYSGGGEVNAFTLNDETKDFAERLRDSLDLDLCLFRINYNGQINSTPAVIGTKLYSFKILEGDEVVRNLVPCVRESDSAGGLYDLVEDVFYVNATSGGHFGYEERGVGSLKILPIPAQYAMPGTNPEPGFTVTNTETGAFWVFAEGGVASGETPFDIAYSFANGRGVVTVTGKEGGDFEDEICYKTFDIYTRVKSITSTGDQYINTGIVPGPTTAVEMRFCTATNFVATTSALFGSGAYNTGASYCFYAYTGMYYFRGAGTALGYRYENGIDSFISVSTNAADNLYLNVGGNISTKTVSLAYADSNTLKIFATQGGANKSRFILYSFKMWKDGELVRDFVPVRSGNYVGLWDLVTSSFFSNAGTGSFIAGPDATDITVAKIPNQFYTGSTLTPSVVVSNLAGTALLTKDVDYTVAYENNAAAGTGEAIVTGIGAYTSVVTNEFAIYAIPAAPAFTSSSYVQNGLMNHWDALDNTGTGTFDPAATTWKDLKGDLDFALTDRAQWGGGFLETTGFAGVAGGKAGKYLTAEIKYQSTKPRCGMPFFSGYGWNRVAWYRYSDQLWFHHANGEPRNTLTGMTTPDAAVREIAVIYGAANGGADSPAMFYDGGALRTTGISNQKYQSSEPVWITSFTRASIGGASATQYNYEGRLYSIRLYDYPLSEKEILYNAAVDKVRYDGVAPAEAFNAPDMRWNATSGKVEVLIETRLVNGTGTLFVNGGGVNAWVSVGDEVTIVYSPDSGEKALEWFGLPDGAPRSTDLFTVNFTAEAPVSATLQMLKKIDISRALNADPGIEEFSGSPVCWNRVAERAWTAAHSASSDERGWCYLYPYQCNKFFQEGLPLFAGSYTFTLDHAAAVTDHTIYNWRLYDATNGIHSICSVTNEMRVYGTSWHKVQVDFTVGESGIYKLETIGTAYGTHGNCYSCFDNISITSDTDLHIEVEKCYPYLGEEQVRPPVVVRDDDGNILTEGVDYELLYGANNSVGTNLNGAISLRHGNGYVAAKGLGSHHGVAGANFRIGKPIYVKPDGLSTNGGTSWDDAVDFATALDLAAATNINHEIWIAGSNVLTSAAASQQFYGNKIFRGGFKGTETTIEEREPGAFSTIDGDGQFSAMSFKIPCNVFIERLHFRDSPSRAVSKTDGGGDMFIDDCVFEDNGNALYVQGVSKTPYAQGSLYVKNSIFRNNFSTNDAVASAALLSCFLRRTSAENSLFVSNTVTDATAAKVKTSAIYANTSAIELKECDFIGNTCGGTSYGTVYATASDAKDTVQNCLFLGNRADGAYAAAVRFNHSSLGKVSEVVNCTFADNANTTAGGCAGVMGVKGLVTVRNSIFFGNDADFVDSANCSLDIDYSLLADDSVTYVFANGSSKIGISMVYGDPLFVAADDCHLLSEAGYFDSKGDIHYATATVLSPAVDAGDPESDYSRESTPNGGCVNLGRYGNTPEASLTPAAEPAVGTPTVAWNDPDEYTMPTVTFTLGGSGSYNAKGTIYVSTDGGQSWEDVSGIIVGLSNGQTRQFRVPVYYVPGSTIQVKVVATSAGETAESGVASAVVSGTLPPWYGKKGPANVIHVRPGAVGKNDGTSWADAFASWADALRAMSSLKNEIWLAGTNLLSETMFIKALTYPAVVRGGFHGWENSPDERETGLLSVIDGGDLTDCLTIDNTATVELERILFKRGLSCGLIKTGAGDMCVSGCHFLTNGMDRATNVNGKGARVSGSKTTTVVTFTNCVFRCNRAKAGSGGGGCSAYGAGINASSLKCVRIEDSLFVHNGIHLRAPGGGDSYQPSAGSSYGSAVYSTAPVSAVGCRFAANFCNVRNNDGNTKSGGFGGVVRLHTGAEGSVFTNCVWVANGDEIVWQGYGTGGKNAAGALVVFFDSNSGTVDVDNCTFAYNLADGYETPAGLNIILGTVNVHNSIFFGNIIGGASKTRGQDISLRSNSVCNVSYTLFGELGSNSVSCAETATANFLDGIVVGDPLFVTEYATMTNLVKESTLTAAGSKLIFWDWTAATADETYAALEAADVHLRGGCGYFDEKTGELVKNYITKVAGQSPAIDAGDPASDYRGEPDCKYGYHGKRVNLGGYGNTPWATMTMRPGIYIHVR